MNTLPVAVKLGEKWIVSCHPCSGGERRGKGEKEREKEREREEGEVRKREMEGEKRRGGGSGISKCV